MTLTMSFALQVWPKVKEQNAGLSVCEIGASIGKMWRELPDEEKTRYNDDFTADKVKEFYIFMLLTYLNKQLAHLLL